MVCPCAVDIPRVGWTIQVGKSSGFTHIETAQRLKHYAVSREPSAEFCVSGSTTATRVKSLAWTETRRQWLMTHSTFLDIRWLHFD